MTIYQPRLESVSTWEISVKDLMEWVEMELKPKAVLAIKGEGEYHSGDWCRFERLFINVRVPGFLRRLGHFFLIRVFPVAPALD